MHSANGSISLGRNICRHLQSNVRSGRSGPATNPEIYVGVERENAPGETDLTKTLRLFSRLSNRMQREFGWSKEEGYTNPSIPAGYTYLAQFVSHDLFLGDESAPTLREKDDRQNLRHAPLRLETLYGRFPEHDQTVFETISKLGRPEALHWPRTRFRMNGVGLPVDDGSKDTTRSPLRDISRIREVRHGKESGCPLVADARNDDHTVISQMTALFQSAHNAIMDLIEMSDSPSDPLDSANNFATAREALTHVYRLIVKKDLISRLMDDDVRAYYEASDDPDRFVLDIAEGKVLSPEFLDAAYRMGHAMVREGYDFDTSAFHSLSEILRTTSDRAPGRTPLGESWIVRWAHFFQFEGRDEPQFSRRMSPKYDAALHDAQRFPASDSPEPGGLAYRDLVRSAVSGVLKVDALAKRVQRRAPDLAALSPWITDKEVRTQALAEWVGKRRVENNREWKVEFVDNPPPNVYFLIEAADAQRGTKLGPLGSIVLAETFYRALSTPDGGERAAQEVFGHRPPDTMPKLIQWVEKHMPVDDKVFQDHPLPLI